MPTNKLIVSLVFFALIACSVSCKERYAEKNISVSDFVDLLIRERNAVGFEDKTFIKEFSQYIKTSNKEHNMIYVLNSSCSDCIGDFCSFVLLVEKCAYNGSLDVVVHEEDIPIIQFYTQKILPEQAARKLHFIKDNHKGFNIDTEYYNHCVIYQDYGKIKAIRMNI